MNYFKDFKNERFHDNNLINLVYHLNEVNRIDLFENALGLTVGECGKFIDGRKKKDFDVLLEFENYAIIIETKVDSAEGYNQTNKIYNKYNNYYKKPQKFIYLTYGLSEFYIKKRSDESYGKGAENVNFMHWTCSKFSSFLESVIKQTDITNPTFLTWSQWLQFELKKREQNLSYLKDVNSILSRYKSFLKLTDYPVNRLNLFLPEFTIPYYHLICSKWNDLNEKDIGKATLYPLGRGSSPANDSILNFTELWDKGLLLCNGLLNKNSYGLYFEFNEDFNLHLKANGNTSNINAVRNYITEKKPQLELDFISTIEDYKQGAFVLFEWDLKILEIPIDTTLKNIKSVINNAIKVLK